VGADRLHGEELPDFYALLHDADDGVLVARGIGAVSLPGWLLLAVLHPISGNSHLRSELHCHTGAFSRR
jgi:hypothetical protein